MSTRSVIGIKEGDKVRYIHCHWDGYPEHQLPILKKYYSSPEKVKQLLALGDISILDNEIGEKQDFNNPTKGYTLAYHRDRNEKLNKPRSAKTIKDAAEMDGGSYGYLFNKGKWNVYDESTKKTVEAIG